MHDFGEPDLTTHMQTYPKIRFPRLSHSLGFISRLVGGVVLLNLLVIGLAAFSIHEDRGTHEERSRIAAENISLLLESDISAVFDRSDLVLRTVVDEIESQLAKGGLQAADLAIFMRQQQSHLPEAISLRVTDENGVVRHGEGLPSGVTIDLSDREHFILPRGNPKAGLIVAKPVKARISQQWSVPLSRRINRPNGDFAGIVYINIPVGYFVGKFSTLRLGVHGLVALRSAEHLSVARFPETQEGGGAVGQFALSDQLRGLLKNDPRSVTYVAHSPTDRIERIYSYRKLANYPLHVIVGLGIQDVLDDWRRDSIDMAAFVAFFGMTTFLFAWLVIRSWRRQVEVGEALRENEQRWSFALESGNFSVWDWDMLTGKVQLSKLGKQLFGYGEDEVGNHIAEWAGLCHPDDRAYVVARMKEHFRGRAPSFVAEFRVRCKDGSWKWILARGLVVDRAADSKPVRMIGLHADISERKQREEELRLASTVFNLADEAMVVTDPQNNILSVNPAFTSITGYVPEEVIGRNPRILSAKTHPAEFYQEMWSRLIETGSWSGEVLNRKKSGEVYVEWLSIKRVLDGKGDLTHHVAVFSDITARKAAEGRMRHLALHDALTDLPNRALLAERLEQAIVRARRDRSHLGLMYFDLDKFKPINDSFGHEVGDWLLKAVAGRVVDCVRESDTVARLGGDEFVVMLPTMESDRDAVMVAEKIRDALGKPFIFDKVPLEISASIGVAIYPENGEDERTLTRNADAAMYYAKKAGRNRVVPYKAGMNEG